MIKRVRMGQAVRVPRTVYDALTFVRNLGTVNMLDTSGVIEELVRVNRPSAARWVRNHRSEYARGVFHGFDPIED